MLRIFGTMHEIIDYFGNSYISNVRREYDIFDNFNYFHIKIFNKSKQIFRTQQKKEDFSWSILRFNGGIVCSGVWSHTYSR